MSLETIAPSLPPSVRTAINIQKNTPPKISYGSGSGSGGGRTIQDYQKVISTTPSINEKIVAGEELTPKELAIVKVTNYRAYGPSGSSQIDRSMEQQAYQQDIMNRQQALREFKAAQAKTASTIALFKGENVYGSGRSVAEIQELQRQARFKSNMSLPVQDVAMLNKTLKNLNVPESLKQSNFMSSNIANEIRQNQQNQAIQQTMQSTPAQGKIYDPYSGKAIMTENKNLPNVVSFPEKDWSFVGAVEAGKEFVGFLGAPYRTGGDIKRAQQESFTVKEFVSKVIMSPNVRSTAILSSFAAGGLIAPGLSILAGLSLVGYGTVKATESFIKNPSSRTLTTTGLYVAALLAPKYAPRIIQKGIDVTAKGVTGIQRAYVKSLTPFFENLKVQPEYIVNPKQPGGFPLRLLEPGTSPKGYINVGLGSKIYKASNKPVAPTSSTSYAPEGYFTFKMEDIETRMFTRESLEPYTDMQMVTPSEGINKVADRIWGSIRKETVSPRTTKKYNVLFPKKVTIKSVLSKVQTAAKVVVLSPLMFTGSIAMPVFSGGGKRVSPKSKVQKRQETKGMFKSQRQQKVLTPNEVGIRLNLENVKRTMTLTREGAVRVTDKPKNQPALIGKAGYTTIFKDGIPVESYREKGQPIKKKRTPGSQIVLPKPIKEFFLPTESGKVLVGTTKQLALESKQFFKIKRGVSKKEIEKRVPSKRIMSPIIVGTIPEAPIQEFPKVKRPFEIPEKKGVIKITGVLKPYQIKQIKEVRASLVPKAKEKVMDIVPVKNKVSKPKGFFTPSKYSPSQFEQVIPTAGKESTNLGQSRFSSLGRKKKKGTGFIDIQYQYRTNNEYIKQRGMEKVFVESKNINILDKGKTIFAIETKDKFYNVIPKLDTVSMSTQESSIGVKNVFDNLGKRAPSSRFESSLEVMQSQENILGQEQAQVQIPLIVLAQEQATEAVLEQDKMISLATMNVNKNKNINLNIEKVKPVVSKSSIEVINPPITIFVGSPIRTSKTKTPEKDNVLKKPQPETFKSKIPESDLSIRKIPRPKPPKIKVPEQPTIKIPDPKIESNIRFKKRILTREKNGGYVAFAKVKGKWKRLSPTVSKKAALDIGASFVKKTLSSTFKIEKGFGTPQDINTGGSFGRYAQSFRTYKVSKGRKIPLINTFIERRSTRLSSGSERTLIKKANKQSRSLGRKAKWF